MAKGSSLDSQIMKNKNKKIKQFFPNDKIGLKVIIDFQELQNGLSDCEFA